MKLRRMSSVVLGEEKKYEVVFATEGQIGRGRDERTKMFRSCGDRSRKTRGVARRQGAERNSSRLDAVQSDLCARYRNAVP